MTAIHSIFLTLKYYCPVAVAMLSIYEELRQIGDHTMQRKLMLSEISRLTS